MKTARIYIRVSTQEQDTTRQQQLVEQAEKAGYYIAGVYSEKASGARLDRPELNRMISDLQPGDVVIAEKMDRISRLPLPEAEKLINQIKAKGATLAIPGVVDLSAIAADGMAKIVLDAVQDMLLKMALQMARDDYETRQQRQAQGIELAKTDGKYQGRKADTKLHQRIIQLRTAEHSIAQTADMLGCSQATVKSVWAKHQKAGVPRTKE
jgi:DNA invertase Pin-like site-specific DNA recombinase